MTGKVKRIKPQQFPSSSLPIHHSPCLSTVYTAHVTYTTAYISQKQVKKCHQTATHLHCFSVTPAAAEFLNNFQKTTRYFNAHSMISLHPNNRYTIDYDRYIVRWEIHNQYPSRCTMDHIRRATVSSASHRTLQRTQPLLIRKTRHDGRSQMYVCVCSCRMLFVFVRF
jgi:hypothetical protein